MTTPRSDLVVEASNGELIVLDKKAGEVHQLNRVASMIWQCLCDGLETNEIANKLSKEFDVGQERATSDVCDTVAQLTELGLLEDNTPR